MIASIIRFNIKNAKKKRKIPMIVYRELMDGGNQQRYGIQY